MSQKILYPLIALLVVLVPLMVGSALLALVHQATIFDAAPFWSDELYHWHQSASFGAAGFESGYYTFDEQTARAPIFHYYAWGPFSYAIYGAFARFFGWELYSYTLVNIVLLAIATAYFIYALRLSWQQLGFLGLVLASFVPLIIYLPSSMQQLLHLAIATVLAVGFYRLLVQAVSWHFQLIFGGFILLAGLIRPTWAVFLLPALILARRQRSWRTIALAGGIAVPLILLVSGLFFVSAADFPHYRSGFISGGAGDFFDSALSLLQYVWFNLTIIGEGPLTAVGQRAQLLLLTVMIAFVGGRIVWQHRRGQQKLQASHITTLWEVAFHLFNLVGFYLLAIALHETIDGRDYRVLAPHLFLSLLLLIAFRRRWIPGIMLASMFALFLPVFESNAFDEYVQGTEPRFNGIIHEQYARWQAQLGDLVVYDPDAPNAWCNTVTTSFFYVIPYAGESGLLLAIDAGIGLSWAWDWQSNGFPVPEFTVPQQFQSRYLMLTDDDFAAWQDRLNLRELLRVQNGALYDNQDAACASEAALR